MGEAAPFSLVYASLAIMLVYASSAKIDHYNGECILIAHPRKHEMEHVIEHMIGQSQIVYIAKRNSSHPSAEL